MKSFLKLLAEKGVTEIRNTLTSLYARYNDVYVDITKTPSQSAASSWHMEVVDFAGPNLMRRRKWDGSVKELLVVLQHVDFD